MNATVDFAVVGAGIAGASVGYELAAHGSVKVFEMESTPGYHSTGRSAALHTDCDGPDAIRRLAMASKGFLVNPPEGLADSPLLHERGVMFLAPAGHRAELDDFVAYAAALVPSVFAIDPGDAVARCPVLLEDRLAGAVIEPDAMDIDVHALHQGFLRGLRHRGGSVATSSPVTGLDALASGWRVTTPGETVDAGIVVNAAGAWADMVGAMAGMRPIGLQPKRRTAFTFPAPPDSGHSSWPMVVGIDETFYFRPEGPNLLASPMDMTPFEPQDIRHDELDVAVAIERIQELTNMGIRSVHSAWAGLRSFVADNLPVVGMDAAAAGFFWLAGQGGYGIMTSPAMSRLAAGLITADRIPPDIAEYGITQEQLSPERLR